MTAQRVTQHPVVVEMPPWGVVVFESHHAMGFRMELSRHRWMEIFYVLEGKGHFDLEGRAAPCIPGDVVIVPAGHGHRIKDDPAHPLALYCARIRPDLWKDFPGLSQRLPAGRLPRNKVISLQVRAEFRWLLFEQTRRRTGYEAMMVGSVLQILALLARGQAKLPAESACESRRTSGLRQAVEEYAAELDHDFFKPASLDSVARELGMSRRRFTDLFHEVTGTTWSKRIRHLRVEHAKELLQTTHRSIASIAFECGFDELSSFYRAFQEEEETSPSSWRQDHVSK